MLLNMLNACMSTNNIPKLWRKAKVTYLLKPGKDTVSPNAVPYERFIFENIAPFVDEPIPELSRLGQERQLGYS